MVREICPDYFPEEPELPKKVFECFVCEMPIVEGQHYFEIDGETFCDECIDAYIARNYGRWAE